MRTVECEGKEQLQLLDKKTSDLERKLETFRAEAKSTFSSSGSSGPSEPAVATTPTMIQSDHIRLTFPTYGGPTDDRDPLNYLSKCHDFLALHPLADADILATFRTVLYGTARDWWEIARTEVTT